MLLAIFQIVSAILGFLFHLIAAVVSYLTDHDMCPVYVGLTVAYLMHTIAVVAVERERQRQPNAVAATPVPPV